MENNIGTKKSIPQIIMAGGSVDDVFVIILFTAFTTLGLGGQISALEQQSKGIILRMIGVLVCMSKTKLNMSERLFCMIAYIPKATIQAAIGSIPLVMGLSCGKIVLTAAVLAILITAPLSAFGIDMTYKNYLYQKNKKIIS